jgi:dolichol-phosphate mannosyltransferase
MSRLPEAGTTNTVSNEAEPVVSSLADTGRSLVAAHEVTVVIPARNEAATIGAVVEACRPHCARVLVVDGHSTDGTREQAQHAGADVTLDGGRGKGDAIRTAIPMISTPYVVFIDADGSHDPGDIPRLVAPLVGGTADHVAGSRLMGGSSELHGGFDEFWRLTGSSFITAVINWRFGVRISDSQNGFRAFRTDALRQLNLRENLTTIEQEMVIKTIKRGFRLCEVPAHEYARRHGVSHIRLSRVSHRYVWVLIREIVF